MLIAIVVVCCCSGFVLVVKGSGQWALLYSSLFPFLPLGFSLVVHCMVWVTRSVHRLCTCIFSVWLCTRLDFLHSIPWSESLKRFKQQAKTETFVKETSAWGIHPERTQRNRRSYHHATTFPFLDNILSIVAEDRSAPDAAHDVEKQPRRRSECPRSVQP